jgi:hypothetical protein
MATTKPTKKTRQQLERQILELESQLAHRYAYAQSEIDKASTSRMMASGVLLQLTALGGREIINPVVIRDGLSPETIAAIKADLHRSYELTVLHKTKGIE